MAVRQALSMKRRVAVHCTRAGKAPAVAEVPIGRVGWRRSPSIAVTFCRVPDRHFGDAADSRRDKPTRSTFGNGLVEQQDLLLVGRLKNGCPPFKVTAGHGRGCPLAGRIATFSSRD
jgi:hypothetical protein